MRIARPLVPLVLVVGLFLGGLATAAAQDATPGGPSEGYPVAIHEGACDNPTAEPAWQLDDAVSIGVNQDDPDVIGVGASNTVTETSGDLDVALDDLAGSEHIVAVHASPGEFGTLVACGNVAGVREDGKLVVPLTATGELPVSGIAIFEEDGDQTHVTVYVIPPPDEGDATPAS